MKSYLGFAIANRRFVTFGFTMAFASSFGQTSFIGVFGPRIQDELGLSHTSWGMIYMVGTLASAGLLPWTGRLIDIIDLKKYTTYVGLLMIAACLWVSQVRDVVPLVIAVFLLRHSGQGLMSHTAVTSMARYFDRGRGRAIAIASLGFTLGEALMPFFAILVIGVLGWRWTYGGAGALVGLALLPLMLWLLGGHAHRHRRHLEQRSQPAATARSWTCAEVLRDPRFYLLIPGINAPPMIGTALFFHHLNLADAKGWTHAWMTGNYIIFAIVGVVVSLAAGRMVDRHGARRLTPFILVPLVCALATIAGFDDPWTVVLYLALLGVSTGFASPTVSSMWAEVYGVDHLGSVKSMATAIGVFSSALGPVTMGALMDRGVGIESVCLFFAGCCVVGTGLLLVAMRDRLGPGVQS